MTTLDEDLKTLTSLNDRLNSPAAVTRVEEAQIHNPTKEVSTALAGFLTSQLARIESNEQFSDLIRMHLRGRMSEASFDQLIQLLHETSNDTTAQTRTITNLFKNEQSGKTVVDTIRDSDMSSTAAKIYSEADSADILQALTYFNQVTSKVLIQNKPVTGEVEVQESDS